MANDITMVSPKPGTSSRPTPEVVHEFLDDLAVVLTEPASRLTCSLEQEVERIWDAEQGRRAAGNMQPLFNGQVFSAEHVEPSLIRGRLVEYKHVLAQMRRPELYGGLRVRQLGVCGAVRCARGGLALGRRSQALSWEPGLWQLPPAGCVDAQTLDAAGRLDVRRQLLIELREEIGLEEREVAPPRILCGVENRLTHVLDLGMLVETRLEAERVAAAFRACGNGEYDRLVLLDETSIVSFLSYARWPLTATTAVLLGRLGHEVRCTGRPPLPEERLQCP